MVIHINPNRINTPAPGKTGVSRERPAAKSSVPPKPPKVEENFIPEPESLATMIRSALTALKQGVTWDRGAILNLLV